MNFREPWLWKSHTSVDGDSENWLPQMNADGNGRDVNARSPIVYTRTHRRGSRRIVLDDLLTWIDMGFSTLTPMVPFGTLFVVDARFFSPELARQSLQTRRVILPEMAKKHLLHTAQDYLRAKNLAR
jgi:hypothetical protein